MQHAATAKPRARLRGRRSAASGYPADSFSTHGRTGTSRSRVLHALPRASFTPACSPCSRRYSRPTRLRRSASGICVEPTPFRGRIGLALLGIPIFVIARHRRHALAPLLRHRRGRRRTAQPDASGAGLGHLLSRERAHPLRRSRRGRLHDLRAQLPLVLGLATWLILAALRNGLRFRSRRRANQRSAADRAVHARLPDRARIGYYKVSSGVLIVIFQSTLIAGFALWLVARITPGRGMFTLLYLIGKRSGRGGIHEPDAAARGDARAIAVDRASSPTCSSARYDPHPAPGRSAAFRCFAVAVPMAYIGIYLLGTMVGRRHLVGLERRARLVDLGRRLRFCSELARHSRAARRDRRSRSHLAALLLHAATAWRYGYFRDELYFIACSKHLAWGYVDQPPLVAVAAWLAAPAGYQLVALRALPILAAALTVYLAIALAARTRRRTFRADARRRRDAADAGLSFARQHADHDVVRAALLDADAIYAAIRIVRAGPSGCATVVGCCLPPRSRLERMRKYSIALLAVAIGRRPRAHAGAARPSHALPAPRCCALAVLVLAPNLSGKAAHGWPFLAVLIGDAAHRPAFQSGLALEYRSLGDNAMAFALEQLLYTNPLAAPLWMAGIVAPFRLRDAARSSLHRRSPTGWSSASPSR